MIASVECNFEIEGSVLSFYPLSPPPPPPACPRSQFAPPPHPLPLAFILSPLLSQLLPPPLPLPPLFGRW